MDLTSAPEENLLEQFDIINSELKRHDATLADKPQLVVLTKNDVTDVRERAEIARPLFEERGYQVFTISAISGDGLKELVEEVGTRLDALKETTRDDGTTN